MIIQNLLTKDEEKECFFESIKNKGPKEQIMPLIQAGPTDCGCPIKEVALTHEK